MIIFLGFKHVGKSSLGRAYAERMGLPFADLDELLEESQACSVRELVERFGVGHFRELELSLLEKALQGEGVLSLGGSTPLNPAAQELLKDHRCIHITADLDLIVGWIQESGRPATFPAGDLKTVTESLRKERHQVYAALANHTVHNHNDYPKLVEELKQILA